jgi:hypothetical protein
LFWCNPGAKYSTLHRNHTPDRKFNPYLKHPTENPTPHIRVRNHLDQLRISRLGVRVPSGALKKQLLECFYFWGIAMRKNLLPILIIAAILLQ